MSAPTLERPTVDDIDAEVDPRIAARRRSVEQERPPAPACGACWWWSSCVGVVAGAWLVTRTGLFDIDRLRVDGATHETADDVVTASGLRPGDQLLDIDSGSVAAKVEQLPVGRHREGRQPR